MKNKRIMIIGGTGALGKSLTKRWIFDNDILIFSRNEHKQEDMRREYSSGLGSTQVSLSKCLYRIGDVKDKESILRCMYEFKPDVIVNTAALKTVWVAQDNPYETILTNIVGHQYLIDCVRECRHQIEALMFISTDKACNPVNVYGMSKGIAEQMYVNFAKEQTEIKVALCRYGNVLDSTGSLIPVFKDILSKTNVLPITHFDMTRFLITLDEAIDLIEWSYHSKDSHGKIIVPKLKSMKIIDFAKSIATSVGQPDVGFEKIDVRDGEKLHEEMISSIEMQRTEQTNDERYLSIGWKRHTEDYNQEPLSSEFHVMNSDEAFRFLTEEKGVL